MHCNYPEWTNKSWINGNLPGVASDVIRKDTVAIPVGGYVVIRFETTNPGLYFGVVYVGLISILFGYITITTTTTTTSTNTIKNTTSTTCPIQTDVCLKVGRKHQTLNIITTTTTTTITTTISTTTTIVVAAITITSFGVECRCYLCL